MIEPGQTFASRYLVRRCIAEGGMGAIFEAEHLATERRVALKLLFPHIMSVASARQKFELEAKVSARVNSPYIVEVLDAGFDEASKSPFLVMELLEGQTLAARVREHGPLGVDEVLRLLEQVAAGLDSAHGYRESGGALKPIVHRDLKPENLFLARQHDGAVIAKILDYGIAKVLGDTTHISQEVRGTPLFMAYEQITAGALSPQTDVWALGLIAYFMLTGARYWRSATRQGSSVQSLFAEILTLPLDAPSVRLREQNVEVALPSGFDAWLLRCIDREPTQRFATAGAAIEALGRVYERAPRAASVRPSVPLARSSDKTQTFVAVDPAARAAAAAEAGATPRPAAVPAAAVGSVPALSATEHRRSLPARVMTSPLHWAAVGAVSGVLVLGGIVWLATRDVMPSSGPVANDPAASDPARAVHAARPAGAAGAGERPNASEPGVSGRQEAVPAPEPRIRIAPLVIAPTAVGGSEPSPAPVLGVAAGGGAGMHADAASAGGTVTATEGPSARPGADPASGFGAASSSNTAVAQGASSGEAATSSTPSASGNARASGGAPRPVGGASGTAPAVAPVAAGTTPAPATDAPVAPVPAKRPRKPLGASEAYRTR